MNEEKEMSFSKSELEKITDGALELLLLRLSEKQTTVDNLLRVGCAVAAGLVGAIVKQAREQGDELSESRLLQSIGRRMMGFAEYIKEKEENGLI